MKLLFTASPATAHTRPLMPLALAAHSAGHEVAFLTHREQASHVWPVEVLPLSGSFADMRSAVVRRLLPDGRPDGRQRTVDDGLTPAALGEMFVRVRMDLHAAEATRLGASFGPELVVADEIDAIGPMIAGQQDVPWASHALGIGLLPHFRSTIDAMVEEELRKLGFPRPAPCAHVDPWPPRLQLAGWQPPANRVPLGPPLPVDQPPWNAPRFERSRPTVLVTFGTTATPGGELTRVLEALRDTEVNVLVTEEPAEQTVREGVAYVGFVPFERLLPHVDVVLTAGGAGTISACLAHGLPMVVLPMVAEQPLNAERVDAAGAGIRIADGTQAGAAVQKVLGDPRYRETVVAILSDASVGASPGEALDQVVRLAQQDAAPRVTSGVGTVSS